MCVLKKKKKNLLEWFLKAAVASWEFAYCFVFWTWGI